MEHTKDWVQTCWVGDGITECLLMLFADGSFAGGLTDAKSTTGGYLCLVGPSIFVPISWICKKQTSVSHSSSEAEVVALDAVLRMEGIPALLLLDTPSSECVTSTGILFNESDDADANVILMVIPKEEFLAYRSE